MKKKKEAEPEATFEVVQGDLVVASAFGPRRKAFSEAMRYAMIYSGEGQCVVREKGLLSTPSITISADVKTFLENFS